MVTSFGTAIPSPRGLFDPPFQAYLLGWDVKALSIDPRTIFDAPIFHPERRTLAYMDHMIGEAVMGWPVFAATGSIASMYNALVLLSTALSGWAVYRLVRLFQVPRAGAFLCGFLFAFGSYRLSNLDLLNQLQTQFLPLGLFFAVRWVERRKRRDAVGALACMTAQIYFGWYYAFYLALALALLVASAWVGGWIRPRAGHVRAVAAALACVTAAVLPVTWPYVSLRAEGGEFERSLGETALYSADVVDYVKWSDRSRLAEALGFPTGGQGYWPGLVTVVLAAVGVRSLRSKSGDRSRLPASTWGRFRRRVAAREIAGSFLLLGILSFVLSLGPVLHLAGMSLAIPLPYAIAYYVIPGVSGMRAPARLAVLVALALVVLAGIGYRRWSEGPGSFRFAGLVVPLLFGVAAAEAWCAPVRLYTLPRLETVAPVVRWLTTQPGDTPVLELPAPRTDADEDETHASRQYAQLLHGKKRLDGCSGYVSRRYRDLRARLHSFPSPDVLDSLGRMGARFVVLHYDDYPPGEAEAIRERIRSEPRLTRRADWTGTAVYELGARFGEVAP